MGKFFERYEKGYYQEVYEELLQLQDHIVNPEIQEDALLVAHEIMRRVRYNLEVLIIPKLKKMGYRFGAGSWDHADDLSIKELALVQKEEPIFRKPTARNSIYISKLEQLVGSLPLSIKCWYLDVGDVSLIGAFHSPIPGANYKSGYGLDPLHTQPLKDVFEELRDFADEDDTDSIMLPISPDGDLKYGYSGGGDYEIAVPCKNFDAELCGEEHHLTFINYLRLCFQWGGFPGLEKEMKITQEELDFLTRDLLDF
ncbi:hypothetical protein [Tengunoibacter tsumagoiensis]|uniref:Uncharacterized protein n=1 Tax=Tengunoibacter tsumagoiensis TaxID=2014871 RepID=A0A402A3C0_9CHLR|nr:hypothetical protein [Tengunoibacter tsumagoiensis]GCE13572.1 hypothetical protein KTT_34310 [Tengunoibacter tsumagoiensis]